MSQGSRGQRLFQRVGNGQDWRFSSGVEDDRDTLAGWVILGYGFYPEIVNNKRKSI
jgi:hypothetical protein